MSEAAAMEFLTHLEQDNAFRDRLIAAPDVGSRRVVIAEAGFGFTPAEIETVLGKRNPMNLPDTDLQKLKIPAGDVPEDRQIVAAMGIYGITQ